MSDRMTSDKFEVLWIAQKRDICLFPYWPQTYKNTIWNLFDRQTTRNLLNLLKPLAPPSSRAYQYDKIQKQEFCSRHHPVEHISMTKFKRKNFVTCGLAECEIICITSW